jgi:hypothetical protein
MNLRLHLLVFKNDLVFELVEILKHLLTLLLKMLLQLAGFGLKEVFEKTLISGRKVLELGSVGEADLIDDAFVHFLEKFSLVERELPEFCFGFLLDPLDDLVLMLVLILK